MVLNMFKVNNKNTRTTSVCIICNNYACRRKLTCTWNVLGDMTLILSPSSLLCPILKQLSHFKITVPFWHKTLPCFEINVLDLLWNNVCPTLKQKVFLAPNFLVDWSSKWWWCHSHVILKNIKCNNFWKCWGHKTWPAGIAGKYEISEPFDG